MNQDLKGAIEVAELSVENSLDWKNLKNATTPEIKSDGSPVTLVDKKLNQFIIEQLTLRFPQDSFIGEESNLGPQVQSASRQWFIDPIDGTKEFSSNSPEWSIMIGLCVDGSPQLSVVAVPEEGKIFCAEVGKGAHLLNLKTKQKTNIHVDRSLNPSELVLISSKSRLDPYDDIVAQQIGIVGKIQKGSIGLKAAMIASGQAHFYLNSFQQCSPWDTLPCEVLIHEAGGIIRGFDFEPLHPKPITPNKIGKSFFITTRDIYEHYNVPLRDVLNNGG